MKLNFFVRHISLNDVRLEDFMAERRWIRWHFVGFDISVDEFEDE